MPETGFIPWVLSIYIYIYTFSDFFTVNITQYNTHTAHTIHNTQPHTPHTRAVARGLYHGRCCVVSLCSVSPMVVHTTVFGSASIIHTTVFGRASMFFLEL